MHENPSTSDPKDKGGTWQRPESSHIVREDGAMVHLRPPPLCQLLPPTIY